MENTTTNTAILKSEKQMKLDFYAINLIFNER